MTDPVRRRPPPELPAGLPQEGLGRVLLRIILRVPQVPLQRPTLPPDLQQRPLPVAMYEMTRHALLAVEYAISPAGEVRGVLKILLRVVVITDAVLLALAAVLAAASLVTAAAAVISGHLLIIALNLLWTLLAVLGCLLVVMAILLLLSLLVRRH